GLEGGGGGPVGQPPAPRGERGRDPRRHGEHGRPGINPVPARSMHAGPPARVRLPLQHDHPPARAGQPERGRQPTQPGPDDHHRIRRPAHRPHPPPRPTILTAGHRAPAAGAVAPATLSAARQHHAWDLALVGRDLQREGEIRGLGSVVHVRPATPRNELVLIDASGRPIDSKALALLPEAHPDLRLLVLQIADAHPASVPLAEWVRSLGAGAGSTDLLLLGAAPAPTLERFCVALYTALRDGKVLDE